VLSPSDLSIQFRSVPCPPSLTLFLSGFNFVLKFLIFGVSLQGPGELGIRPLCNAYRRTRDYFDRMRLSTFAVRCSFAARFTFSELVDRIALAGAPRTGNSWDRSRGLVGRLKPAARLSVAIRVDGKPAKPSMAEPPTPNRIRRAGPSSRLKDSGPRASLPSTFLTF